MTLRARAVDFNSTWNDLGDVCIKVLRCDYVPTDRWCRSFSDVYTLTVSRPVPHDAKLYDSVATLIKNRICEISFELCSVDDSSLLTTYASHWATFRQGLDALNNLFKFVNSYYVLPKRPTEADMCYGEVLPSIEKHNMEIEQLGLCQWKMYLLDPIQPRITACLLLEVANDRIGISSQQQCIGPCIESFSRIDELKGLTKVPLNVYLQLFEIPLIDETRVYYNNWTTQALASKSCATFISEALNLLTEETRRAEKYFPDSKPHITNLFKDVVVVQHLDYLNSCIPQYVQEEDRIALSSIYRLLEPTNHCDILLSCFMEHVRETANAAIAGMPSDQNLAPAYFVSSMLNIRERFTDFITEVFNDMSAFRTAMDKAFIQAINTNFYSSAASATDRSNHRAAEYLSRYMDNLLRKTTKLCTETELERKISSSINLFLYLEEKDVFKQYYQRNLCYRLIFGSSTMLDLEEATINQLHAVCGYEFTSKFQRMFNDMQICEGLNSSFQTNLQEKDECFPFSHNCKILTMSAWPIQQKNSVQFNLPAQLLDFSTKFEAFYAAKYNGRNLRWILSHCTAETRCLFADRPYTLLMSALCATTVMLFESRDVDALSVSEITMSLLPDASLANQSEQQQQPLSPTKNEMRQQQLSAAEREEVLRRAILPLVEAGLFQLQTHGGGTSEGRTTPADSLLVPGTVVVLNKNFTNKHARVKIAFSPQIIKTQAVEAEQVQKEVEEDRRYFTQAALVRIMKDRKTCRHTLLIQAVLDQAKGRFQPAVSLIKRCIETLIDKGYLERSPNDPDHYNYLA